jgi:hypothetical protein
MKTATIKSIVKRIKLNSKQTVINVQFHVMVKGKSFGFSSSRAGAEQICKDNGFAIKAA